MANPHTGEVGFKSGGKDYKLSYSAEAICELESSFDMSVGELGDVMGTGKFRMEQWRTVFWVGLQDHHPGLTIDQTKEILRGIKPGDLTQLIQSAFGIAFPQTEAQRANGQVGDARPTSGVPNAGTGLHS